MSTRFLKEQSGRNLSDIKLINRSVIFRAIREAGAISRASLSEQTGLHPATITHITRELLDKGLIIEAGLSESLGGRPRTLLQINAQHAYVIAVRLARHNIQSILTDLNLGHIIRRTVTSSSLTHPVEISIPAMLGLIEALIIESGLKRDQIIGMGVCAPGPLDTHQGILYQPPNFPGWPLTPIRQIVEDKLGLPTFLDNDANAAALAEKWFGRARDLDNFIYVLIEDGVGGGLMLNGDIYRGNHDAAGEIGHMTIDLDGPKCDCGNVGCLELYASPRAAEAQVCRSIKNGRSTLITDWIAGDLDKVDFDLIVRAALESDPVALEAIQTIVAALTAGIVNVINAYDPEAVIIGGKIVLAKQLILERLRAEVTRRLMPRGSNDIAIYFSELDSDAPLIGAFSLVLQELFQNPAFHSGFASPG